MNKKNLVMCFLIGATALAGCGSKTDANEKNFGIAINQFLDKTGELCLINNFGFGEALHWPVDIIPRQRNPFNDSELAALSSAGLATISDAEISVVEHVGMFGSEAVNRKYKVKRYSLTELGEKSLRQQDSNICYGKAILDKVVKWEGPRKDGDYQEALVTYTYQIKDQAEWVKNPLIQSAFIRAKRAIDGAGKQEQAIAIKLTSQGWESKL